MVHITNGLLMLLSFVKHQNEYDRNVKFSELHNAIGHIDIAMKDFSDTPNDKLSEARSLNEHARLRYHRSVSPVVGWCNVAIDNFGIIIPLIKDESLSRENREFILHLIGTSLDEGFKNTAQSMELLRDVQYKSYRVVNLLDSIRHDVYNDFSKQKTNLDEKLKDVQDTRATYKTLSYIPIVNIFSAIVDEVQDNKKERIQLYKKNWNLNKKFNDILKKIMDASEISKTGVNPNLERDDTNLSTLRGKTGDANHTKILLTADIQFLRDRHAQTLQALTTQCRDYIRWHEVHN